MTEREHRANRKWNNANKKRRVPQKTSQQIMDITPPSSPRPGTPAWNFFEAGHGKRAAVGVGGYLKCPADKIAAGSDISKAEVFFYSVVTFKTLKNTSLPKNLVPIVPMHVHQVYTDTLGELQYRDLSCFCQRGFCSFMNPKTYQPIPAIVIETLKEAVLLDGLDEEIVLDDISNTVVVPRKTY
ncbi:unnamed protein product [Pieris brassicae]|uniref:Uncharacterized protein n=1 Tax=Pieris brassicae TaxID=7116 RepID=A0A9P0XE37_PIEBR|nr:unnamed protein product [Pieris brassicae]CAH4036398.1 unnamed protein product [Pieris brassicae]